MQAQGGTEGEQQARGPDQGDGEGILCVMEMHSKERGRSWSTREMGEEELLRSSASGGRRLGFCLEKGRAAPGGKGLSQLLWERWVSKGRAGSVWVAPRGSQGRSSSTANLVVNSQVFFSHCMKGFAAANTLFKEIHPDSSREQQVSPRAEQAVAPQTGGDMTMLRTDMLLKKKI